MNGKLDVTKRQFDEFVEVHQKRVGEFEQAFGKALVDTKLEFQLETQKTEEGYLASTKMLKILQKELGDFIDQNGRHVRYTIGRTTVLLLFAKNSSVGRFGIFRFPVFSSNPFEAFETGERKGEKAKTFQKRSNGKRIARFPCSSTSTRV